MDLIYFATGASLLPLVDVMVSKQPRTMVRYAIYIGFLIGVWVSYIVSKVIP